MSKADKLRAAAAHVAETTSAEPETAESPERVERAKASAAVRTTLDLQPVEHRRLGRWCAEAADLLDVTEVKKAAVLRALLAELHEDADLAARVRQRIITA